jgi:hypothetical protein
MSSAMKREEIHQAWEKFRNGTIAPGTSVAVAQQLKSDPKTTNDYLTVMQKIAKEHDFEDFANYVETKELPAIKLSASEMESLKGGTISPIRILKLLIDGVKFFC